MMRAPRPRARSNEASRAASARSEARASDRHFGWASYVNQDSSAEEALRECARRSRRPSSCPSSIACRIECRRMIPKSVRLREGSTGCTHRPCYDRGGGAAVERLTSPLMGEVDPECQRRIGVEVRSADRGRYPPLRREGYPIGTSLVRWKKMWRRCRFSPLPLRATAFTHLLPQQKCAETKVRVPSPACATFAEVWPAILFVMAGLWPTAVRFMCLPTRSPIALSRLAGVFGFDASV